MGKRTAVTHYKMVDTFPVYANEEDYKKSREKLDWEYNSTMLRVAERESKKENSDAD